MDRKEVEALLAVAEAAPDRDGVILPISPKDLAALCRTQLAVWDAEVLEGGNTVDTFVRWQAAMRQHEGQRVRIVPEGA